MTPAKTNAQRQADFRARRASTPEVRGIFARPEDHAAIKKAASKITKSSLQAKSPSPSKVA